MTNLIIAALGLIAWLFIIGSIVRGIGALPF
jgi:hypothetical protein